MKAQAGSGSTGGRSQASYDYRAPKKTVSKKVAKRLADNNKPKRKK